MGILEELAIVRDRVEKGQLDNRELIQEVEKIAKDHHDNIVVLYDGERFDEFKRYWITTVLGLRSLVELLQSEPDNITMQEGLYPATLLCYFLKEAHLYIRTENGTKLAESIFLLLARILKPLKKLQVSTVEEIRTCMDLTSIVLTGIEAYKRKSYRQVYILPELNVMLQKTLQSYANALNDHVMSLDDDVCHDLQVMFMLTSSMFQNEENIAAFLAKEVNAIIKAVKHALSGGPSSVNKDKTAKKKNQKVAVLSPECTQLLTKSDLDAAESLLSLVSQPLPQLDCQNLPQIRVKDLAPKIFDKEDEGSAYNLKYKQKLAKEKLRRVKSQTYRNLAQDAKVMQDDSRSKMDHLDVMKKKKFGEFMKHIQEQQEQIKKEGTMNYNAPARKKNKKTRMAGGQMVQSQTGNSN